jgi:hypothetical protein
MGKLPIELYAHALETAAVGLSLMSSPHPSYPPLEMAHYGIRTVTNGYACKEMSKAHGNIVSVRDVLPSTVAAALAESCASFIRDPQAGWAAKSNVEGYVDGGPYPFMPELVATLARSPAKVEAGTA